MLISKLEMEQMSVSSSESIDLNYAISNPYHVNNFGTCVDKTSLSVFTENIDVLESIIFHRCFESGIVFDTKIEL
jgi:hypothetical protein